MELDIALKESRLHGDSRYAFEMYRMPTQKTKMIVTGHWHDELEIIYIIKGRLNINIGSDSFIGTEGDAFFINKGEMHDMYGDGETLLYYAFVFSSEMLSFRREDFAEQQFIEPLIDGSVRFLHKITERRVADILKRIADYNESRSTAYMLATKAALLELIAYLIDGEQYTAEDYSPEAEERSALLKKIILYIRSNYTEPIPLERIAQEVNMSPKYFCRFFKSRFNKTFVEYVNAVRIESAIRLLESRDLSVTETAVSCGFYNMSYFTRTFKRQTGNTPSDYRKKQERMP